MDMEFEDIRQLITEIVNDIRTAQADLIRDVLGTMLSAHATHSAEVMKAHQSDHDALVRLAVLSEQMAHDVSDIKGTHARHSAENESRIRELEASRWKLAGVLGLLSIITPVVATFLIRAFVR